MISEGGRLRTERCAICGGDILAMIGVSRELDALSIRSAVYNHQSSQRHTSIASTYVPCGCPVELRTGVGCLVLTPTGRVCQGCQRAHAA